MPTQQLSAKAKDIYSSAIEAREAALDACARIDAYLAQLENERQINEMAFRALQEFRGFYYAEMGFSIECLAKGMELTPEQWAVIRDNHVFTERSRAAIDNYFYGENK
ncbi:hypothetical protein AXE65_02340 [Ventosimonas gracilis]|uniref:Uncharacterized protein n=1 Tax=Ventosimonas gracilis TaxID=1680762 RepID=A0A139SUW0_9GAMM|nr:hypothetical protein [Ventosimonas gracilis]KXU38251.1 hypothetical protein AXE65_02340 [Ventosimonas gracilis]